MRHLVLITSAAQPREHGTGFVIRQVPGGGGAVQVVTAAHVVRSLGPIDHLRVAGRPATLVVDLEPQGIDLAVLEVAGLVDHEPVTLAVGRVGDVVELQGYRPPSARAVLARIPGMLAEQTIVAERGINRPVWRIEVDRALSGGESGGPVLAPASGHVVGVIVHGPERGGGDAIALAIENLLAWTDGGLTLVPSTAEARTAPVRPGRPTPRRDSGATATATGDHAVTILHLSDLQFGRYHRFGRLAAGEAADAAYDTLARRLCDDLDVLRRDHDLRPDLIALTGDLAEWGRKRELEGARAFVETVRGHLGLGPDRALVIPGNHDINRDKCEAYFKGCAGDEITPEAPYWPKWEPFAAFFGQLYADVDRYRFTALEPWTLFELPELRVVVAGLNSTIADSHRDEDHHGFVGEAQLAWFARRLDAYVQRGWLRIGLVHHNAVRRAARDDENLRDADDLRERLGDRLHLLLHGHTHEGRLELLGPTLPVLATGSAAVAVEQRPDEVPNQYQIVQVRRDGLRWFARQYTPQRKTWIGDTRVSRRGDAWWCELPIGLADVDTALPAAVAATPAPGDADGGRARVELADGRASRELRDRGQPEGDLLAEVMTWCRILGGERVGVERIVHAGPWGDHALIRDRDDGASLLGAVEGTLTIDAVERWLSDVVAPFRARGRGRGDSRLIVGSAEPIAAEVVRHASARGVAVQRLMDYQGVLDVAACRAALRARLELEPAYPQAYYLEQRVAVWGSLGAAAEVPEPVDDAADWLVARLLEPGGRFVVVLGNAGAGKSFLLRAVAHRLDRASSLVTPLLVDLRQLEQARDVSALAAEHFERLKLPFNPRAFARDVQDGRIALLFDGFDELALRVRSAAIPEHFARIRNAAVEGARIVVTSRTEHFLSRSQVSELVGAGDVTALGAALVSVPRRSVVEVLPFRPDDIVRYLRRRLGDEAGAARFALLARVHDLIGLASTPRMLAFLVDIPEAKLVEAAGLGTSITSAALYELVVERSWLAAECARLSPAGARQGPTVEALLAATTQLALRLWREPQLAVQAADLDVASGGVLAAMFEGDHDAAASTLRSRSLLTRAGDGRIQFIHQTVLEWLVARAIADELRAGGASAQLAAGRLNRFMIDLLRELAGPAVLAAWSASVLGAGAAGVVAENARDVNGALGIVERRTADLRGQDLRGQDLRGQDLRGAVLDGADLSGLRLVGRDLTGASLRGAHLADADLTDANLTDADLTGADLSFARLHRTELRGAQVGDVAWLGASLARARNPPPLPGPVAVAVGAPPATDGPVTPTPAVVTCGSGIQAVAWRPANAGGGRLLATADLDGGVRIWDAARGRALRTIGGHDQRVTSVAWRPDGAAIATGSADRTVRLWTPEGAALGTLVGHESGVTSLAWSPDGSRLLSGGDDGALIVWTPGATDEVRVVVARGDSVLAVAWSPDGGRIASGGKDHHVRVRSLAGDDGVRVLKGHDGQVWTLAWNPVDGMLASGASDGVIRLWRSDGRLDRVLKGHDQTVWSVAWSPDGQTLATASADETVRLWPMAPPGAPRVMAAPGASVWGVAWSPDGRVVAAGTAEPALRIWNVDAGGAPRVLAGSGTSTWSVTWSADGRSLASGGDDGRLRVWSPAGGAGPRALSGDHGPIASITWSPDGATVAAGTAHNAILLWSAVADEPARTLLGHRGRLLSVAWSPDGRTLASGALDGSVRLWPTRGRHPPRVLTGAWAGVASVAWSPDGRLLAWCDVVNASVWVWPTTGEAAPHRVAVHRDNAWSVAWSPDGQTLASGGDDQTVRLWTLRGASRELHGHHGRVATVAWSPDGRLLASASADRTVRLWSFDGAAPRVLEGHGAGVLEVAWHPGGDVLASVGHDGTTRLWRVADGRCLAIVHATATGWVAFLDDGRYQVHGDVSDSFWHVIGLHRYDVGELDELFPGLRIPADRPLLHLGDD